MMYVRMMHEDGSGRSSQWYPMTATGVAKFAYSLVKYAFDQRFRVGKYDHSPAFHLEFTENNGKAF